MFALLTPAAIRAIAAAAVLAALTAAYFGWRGAQRDIGRAEVRAEWQASDLARAEANRILLMANAKTSDRLQTQADKERTALHEQNRSIGLELAESLRRLRNRPERPPAASGGDVPEGAVAAAAGSGDTGCTGDRLYRDDSEALVRLGAAGDRLRVALRSCRAAYERIEAEVNATR